MAKYVCPICGYEYDEANESVKFSDLPTNWECPICGANKSLFNKIGEEAEPIETKSTSPIKSLEVNNELTAQELYLMCSNLAKSCEKQQKEEEQAMYNELASYFKKQIKKDNETQIESLQQSVQNDLENLYQQAKDTAISDKDRGALRALTWSEKVTKITSGLLSRYINEGDGFLQNHNIYVCEICGFIAVGDNKPDVCPICKVPNVKIHEVGGQNNESI